MIPSADVAIVTVTNAAPVGAAEAVNAAFDDLVEFGQITRDWYPAFHARMQSLYVPEGSLAGKPAPAESVPVARLITYAGRYANSYYGDAVVEERADGLLLKMGPGGTKTYALRHWSGNTFVFDLTGENAEPGSISRVDFRPEPPGQFSSLQMEYFSLDRGRGVFTRVP